MCLTEYDEEEFKRVCRNDGRYDQAIEASIAFLKKGIPPETIAECENLPLKKVLELQESITEKA